MELNPRTLRLKKGNIELLLVEIPDPFYDVLMSHEGEKSVLFYNIEGRTMIYSYCHINEKLYYPTIDYVVEWPGADFRYAVFQVVPKPF